MNSSGNGGRVSSIETVGQHLEIFPEEGLVLAQGKPVKLTPRETQVLMVLARNPERVMTRDDIHREVWGGERPGGDRSVDVYAGRVRARLAKNIPDRTFIHTHTGIGYRFSPDGA